MTYRISKLAPGSYDVILNGVVIAGLVRTNGRYNTTWTAELLVNLPASDRPRPFSEQEHQFPTLGAACCWLGLSEADLAAYEE